MLFKHYILFTTCTENNKIDFTGSLLLFHPNGNDARHIYHDLHNKTKDRMGVLRLYKDTLGIDGFTDDYLDSNYEDFTGKHLKEIFQCSSNQGLHNLDYSSHYYIKDDISAILIHF